MLPRIGRKAPLRAILEQLRHLLAIELRLLCLSLLSLLLLQVLLLVQNYLNLASRGQSEWHAELGLVLLVAEDFIHGPHMRPVHRPIPLID